MKHADLILKSGLIQTMEGDRTAQAVAVCRDTIVYVGDDAGASAYEGSGTKIIDLAGKYVIPGFIDGHTHEVMSLIDADTTLNLGTVETTLEAYKKAFSEFVETHPDNEMYYGESMDINVFPEGMVTNEWLNEICPDKPISITDMSYHANLINQKAMEMIRLTKDTKAPSGANIYRYENGEPTGFIVDGISLLEGLPTRKHTREKFYKAFLEFQNTCNSYGITGIDVAGPTIDDKEAWEVFHEMEEKGELKLRVNSTAFDFVNRGVDASVAKKMVERLDEYQKYNSDFQRISQAKILMDGVPEAKSAYLLEPYAPETGSEPDFRGDEYSDPENVKEFVTIVNQAGYQVQIHAMGDGAIHDSLNCFEHSRKVNGDQDFRNMIAHVTLITDEDIKRMADLKVIGTMQPLWWYFDPNFSPLEKQMFGEKRFQQEYHIRDMMDAGIRITGSIDYPVQLDFRPLYGIEAGVTQCSPYPGQKGDPAYTRNPDQGVTPMEMLQCYTVNGAYEMKMEDLVGSIAVGKKADLAVLEHSILDCDAKEIAQTKVCCTIMNGKIVYEG